MARWRVCSPSSAGRTSPSSPCSAPRSATRSRSTCGWSSPTRFGALGEDAGVGAIVLTGAGPAFCSGMDVTQFGGDRANRERLVETSIACFRAVGNCTKPVVAAVNGPALAGGFALALLSDLRLASEYASFGFPELPRGIPPSYAAARAALPASAAAELTLTGRLLDADGAMRMGIVEAVHPAGRADAARAGAGGPDRHRPARRDRRDEAAHPARPRAPVRPSLLRRRSGCCARRCSATTPTTPRRLPAGRARGWGRGLITCAARRSCSSSGASRDRRCPRSSARCPVELVLAPVGPVRGDGAGVAVGLALGDRLELPARRRRARGAPRLGPPAAASGTWRSGAIASCERRLREPRTRPERPRSRRPTAAGHETPTASSGSELIPQT